MSKSIIGIAQGGTGAITAPAALAALGGAPSASPSFTGSVAIAGGAIEIGPYAGGGATTPYIDFHSSGAVIDYDARIIASGGNGSVGNGALQIQAGQLTLPNSSVGIGTTTLSAKLTVSGANGPIINANGNTTAQATSDISATRSGASESATVGQGANLQLTNSTNNTNVMLQQYNNNLQIFNFTGNVWTERLRLDGNGLLGLGTVPTCAMDVYKDFGGATASTSTLVRDSVNSLAVMPRLTAGSFNGATGLGDMGIVMMENAANNNALLVGKHNGAAIRFGTAANATLSFCVGGGVKVTMDTSGNINTGANVNAGRVILANGSATNPSLSFSSDGGVDTGIYWGGDGYTNFSSNGVYAGQFGPGGNLSVAGSFYGGGAGLTGTALSLNIGGNAYTATRANAAASLDNHVDMDRSAADVNTMITNGTYGFSGTPANCPSNYGAMMVARNSDTGLQIAGGYLNDALYFRGWASSGSSFSAWRTVIHNANIGSYAAGSAPVLTGPAHTNGTDGWFRSSGVTGWFNETYGVGLYANDSSTIRAYNNASFAANNINASGVIGASGSITAGGAGFIGLGTNLTGTAAGLTAQYSNIVASRDIGGRTANEILPTTSAQNVRFDFVGAATVGTAGNYAGLMTYAPWTGTAASTGDASYQLAFGSLGANASGQPKLQIRNGIDSTWNAWYTLMHSGNIGAQSVNYAASAGNSSTVNSINGGPMGEQHTWTAANYFVSNFNTAGGTSPALMAYSNNGSGAVMSFHRGGSYAVNFGLDSDNVMRLGGWSAPANLLQCDMAGNLTMAGNITAYSDERLKKNIAPIKDALSTLLSLTGVTFNRKDNDQAGRGFIAQQVQKFYPELVQTMGDSDMLSVAYANFAGDFVEALREMDTRMKAVEAKQVEMEKQAAVQAQQVNDRLAALEAKFN